MTASTSMKHYKWNDVTESVSNISELVGLAHGSENLFESGKATSWSMPLKKWMSMFLPLQQSWHTILHKIVSVSWLSKKAILFIVRTILFSVWEFFLDRMPLPFRKKRKDMSHWGLLLLETSKLEKRPKPEENVAFLAPYCHRVVITQFPFWL